MENLFNRISVAAGIVLGALSYVFGAFDTMIRVLAVVMVIDYITGVIKGIYNKELSSYTGWRGIIKKCSTLCVVALANMAQLLLGGNVGIRDIVIVFYIANEGLSILENVAEVSTAVPEPLRKVLMQLRKGKNDEDN